MPGEGGGDPVGLRQTGGVSVAQSLSACHLQIGGAVDRLGGHRFWRRFRGFGAIEILAEDVGVPGHQ